MLSADDDDNSDSDDFEEVPTKEGYEERIPRDLLEDLSFDPLRWSSGNTDWNIKDHLYDKDDPTTFAANVQNQFCRDNKPATQSRLVFICLSDVDVYNTFFSVTCTIKV